MPKKSPSNTVVHISSKTKLNLTFNLCQCGKNEIQPRGTMTIDANDTYFLVSITAGSAMLNTGHSSMPVGSSQGFFTFPDFSYQITNSGDAPLSLVWLSFTGYSVEHHLNRANLYKSRPVFEDDAKEVQNRLNRIYDISLTFPNRYCPMMSLLYDTFAYLLDANPTKGTEVYVESANLLAIQAVDYIEHHYAQPISVEDIADGTGISLKQLYLLFNETLQIPPKQYLIYYRMEKACQRLKSTPLSVAEIADSVGYSNQFYFSKEFKRLTGMTPTEYRKNPNVSEILSYRTFIPTVEGDGKKPVNSLVVEEPIISIYTPPHD